MAKERRHEGDVATVGLRPALTAAEEAAAIVRGGSGEDVVGPEEQATAKSDVLEIGSLRDLGHDGPGRPRYQSEPNSLYWTKKRDCFLRT